MKERSIEQIENCYWGEPNFSSSLVINCYKARKKPIGELDNNDLRLLISQDLSKDIIIPIALSRLTKNPLLCASFFEGDLLCTVCKIDRGFWIKYKDWYNDLLTIINTNGLLLQENEDFEREEIDIINDFVNLRIK